MADTIELDGTEFTIESTIHIIDAPTSGAKFKVRYAVAGDVRIPLVVGMCDDKERDLEPAKVPSAIPQELFRTALQQMQSR